MIARHPRSYEREEMIFDPLHYLALLEQKTNALDQAAPLEGWELPEEFARTAAADGSAAGQTRQARVRAGAAAAGDVFAGGSGRRGRSMRCALRAISFDAVKHLLLCAIEQRPPRLDLENYPHLPVAQVALTRAADYQVLLAEAR